MKQKNYTSFMLLLCLWVLGVGNVKGQVSLPHHDVFNYTVGQGLQTQTGWTATNTGDDVAILSGNLSYTGMPTSTGNKIGFAGSGIDTYKTIVAQNAGSVYYSFILNVKSMTGVTDVNGGYLAGFIDDATTTTFGGTIWTKRVDDNTFNIGLEVRTATGANTTYTTANYTTNTPYLVVVKYTFVTGANNDEVKLWVNPVIDGTEPTSTLTDNHTGTDLANIGKFFFRQDSATETPDLEIDELRIGTTWTDVVPAPAATATLNVNPTSLSGFTTIVGTASAEQSYTLSGTDLTGFPDNIVVTAPTGYEVSLTSGSGFAGSVNVPYTSATLSNTNIFVRIAASASVGSPSGNITNVGGGATTQNVAVSGNVNPLTATLNVNPTSLSGFTTITGTASAEQSYTLSGTNLTGFPDNIVVTAPTGYEVSLTSGSGFGGSVNVPYTSGTLSNTTIFVRIAASASVGSPSGNVTNIGGGATTQNVAVSGTVNPVPTPTLTVNPTSLSGFTTTTGTASANQSYTLSGTGLTGFPANITVTAPTGYEVSLTSGSGFAGSVNVPYTSATLSNTTIFVRIAASASVGSPSGNVTNAGGGATTQNVAVSGTVNAAPTVVPIANIRNAIDGSGAQVAPYAAGTAVMIQGQIYGVNRNIDATVANGTRQKFEFTVIDNSTGRNGIVIRSTGTVDIAPVDLLEGDNITVSGTVSQFNGLTQITATAVTRNSTGNTRKTPVNATVIAENEESQLIRLTGVTVTTWPSAWTGSGQNASITVGANTYTLRITSASELWNKTVVDVFGSGATLPVNNVTMVGLGGQFDNASPFDSGYQLFVTKLSDVTIPPPIIPAISTNASSTGLDFGSVTKNEVSASQTYKLIGKDLPTTGSNLNVIVTVPNNFQVSKNNTDFFSTVSFTNAEINNAGTAGLDVYVRFAPTSDIDGAKGGDVTHAVPALVPTLNTNVAVKGIQVAPLSIAEELASQVNIYPNPANGTTIKIDAPQNFSVEMLDITGRKVGSFNSSEPKLSENLPNGLYFLQFSNGTTKFVKRLVIQK